jgi:hypothetical protein
MIGRVALNVHIVATGESFNQLRVFFYNNEGHGTRLKFAADQMADAAETADDVMIT